MELSSIILQIVFLISFAKMLAFGFVEPQQRRCEYKRLDKLLKVFCHDMNLKAVPQYLKSSVEVMDLSYNRIKKLNRSSFQRYDNVKFLLLYENMIQFVEPGTFEGMTSLQEIDLSNNGLMTIPLELLQLPSLRNLYMDNNVLKDLENDLIHLETPIRAPLEYLNLADCDLQNIPDFGILPKLWQINASSNPLNDLSMDRFSNMCNLKIVDLTKTTLNSCSCQQVNNHLRYLGINNSYVPVCLENIDVSKCPLPFNQTIQNDTFKQCKTIISVQKARSMWIFGAGCVGGAIIVILLVWYCIHRRRKQRAKKRKAAQNRKNFVISPKNAINNNRKAEDELLHCDKA